MRGPHGRAWAVPAGAAPAQAALVAVWMVEAPQAHPIWHSYLLTVAHLRPTPGMPPPIIYLAGATHELLLAALDPAHPRAPALDGARVRVLQPFNFAAQLVADDDGAAARRVRLAAQAVCDGRLSPDTDHRAAWAAMFGGNMLRG